MKERWDERCRDILLAARQESVDMENHFLGTEHVALAMLADPDSLLSQLLESLDLDTSEIRVRVREQSTKGPLEHGPNIPITPRMRHIVAQAEQLSIQDGADLIQEGHFLTALLDGGPGVVVRVLEEFGVSVPDLVVDLRECMFGGPEGEEGENGEGRLGLDEIATVAGPARRPPLLHTPAKRGMGGGSPDKPAEEPVGTGTHPSRRNLRDEDGGDDGDDLEDDDSDDLAPTLPRRPGLFAPRSPLAAPPQGPLPSPPPGRKVGLTGTRPSRAGLEGAPPLPADRSPKPPPDLSGARNRSTMPGTPLLLDLGVMKARQAPGQGDSGNILDKLGRDLTELAERGHLGPIVGRDAEIEELALALCRASRNNPLLLGEPGVGKTAIVEGLAIRITEGQVPRSLKRARLIELPVAAVSADTRFRGELEERLLAIVEEAKKQNVVLVVDDIHALLGGTHTHGSADAGTILKPYLARGDIRLIGTTTPRAYAMHIERDTALARCFHPIRVEEPEDDVVAEILLGICERFESFHRVSVLKEALEAVIVLGRDCVKDRRMPDVAVDLLDQSCVKAAASVEDRLGMEEGSQRDGSKAVEREHGVVTAALVAQVVSRWTGIPVEKLTLEESMRMVDMEEELGHQVIGQEDAVSRVCERIRMYKAGFHDERRPLGVFLFLGPTGVGKTELARALARFLFKSDEHLHRFDMSEFGQAHEVAKLIGSPPGYVGHEEEGQLTGAVRRDPHCLILLDEIEKAHARVFDLFLQVFDEGRLTDGKGVTTDFTHTLIILTSNMGADLWKERPRMGFRREEERQGADREGAAERSAEAHDERKRRREEEDRRRRIRDTLKETFRSEFINRLDDVVLFRSLTPEHIRDIAWQMVERWQKKSRERGHVFEITEEALDFLCQEGYDEELGARPLKRVIEERLIQPLSRQILRGRIRQGERIVADLDEDRIVFFQEEYDSGA